MTAGNAAPSKSRSPRRPRDMILSMAVLLVPLGLIFGFWNFIGSDNKVSVIDPSGVYVEGEAKGLPVVTPAGLSDGWKPVSSAIDSKGQTVTIRVGFFTPEEDGAQLIESNLADEQLLEEELGKDLRLEDTLTIDGRDWQLYRTKAGNNAMVSSVEGFTLVLHGDASMDELRDLAVSLS